MASPPGPLLLDSVESNSSWILALSAARNGGVVHGGWNTISPQVEQRRFSNGDVYTEEEFMAVLDDILIALQTNGIGQREQEELLLANYNLRRDIVRV